MVRNIKRVYKIVAVLMVALCVLAVFMFRLDIRQMNPFPESKIVDTIAYSQWDNHKSPTGKSDVYTFQFSDIHQDYNKLYIYTVHQNVTVYIGGHEVYSVSSDGEGLYSKTTGRLWSKLVLLPEDRGELIQVECVPCFSSTEGLKPTIIFGEKYDVLNQIVLRDLLVVSLSCLIVIVGLAVVVTGALRKLQGGHSEAMLCAGIFAFLSGLWKLVQCPLVALLTTYIPPISMVSYMCLTLVGIPYLLSVKAMLEDDGKIWYVPLWINIGNIVVCLGLFVAGIMELKQSVVLTVIALICVMLTASFKIFKRYKKEGMTDTIRLAVIETGACAFWFLCDALIYYFSKGEKTSAIGIVGVGVYLAVVLKASLDHSSRAMEEGMQARQFAKLAFRDAMTGFYNRAAYADHLDTKKYVREETIALVCDLNDLKKCNDTYGHAKGDYYIKESAKIIEKCFADLGDCYRLGGDEFTVLMSKVDKDTVAERCEQMLQMVKAFNEKSEDIKMGIAHGYAWFDTTIDIHFEDMLKRADLMMYENKKIIKAQNV